MDDSELASLLIPEKSRGDWSKNSDYTTYLNELSSFSVDRLSNEPERLEQEQKRLLHDTRDLAFRNYRGFIQTAACSKDIFVEFKQLGKIIVRLQERLPLLTEQCHSFVREAPTLTSKRHSLFATLQYHTQLLEILEIPQLMETCVRNGHYEEALDLDNTVTRISRKHGCISLFAQVVEEVAAAKKVMLTQLMQLLRGNINLPACLRIVGHLRRVNCFTEKELRLKFLSARGSWLKTNLNTLSNTDVYSYTNKYIEICRIGLFDIVTHYRAIFPDSGTRKGDLQSRQLMYGWVDHIVADFLQVLKTNLSMVTEGALLNSLLAQCMYLGSSLGRVGIDFRCLLPMIFCDNVVTLFTNTSMSATTAFMQVLKTKPRDVTTSSAGAASLHRTVSAANNTSSSATDLLTVSPNYIQPSVVLNEFPHLARLVNGYVEAFNNLRHCAPFATAKKIREILEHDLQQIVDLVVLTHRNVFEAREDDDPGIVKESQRFMEVLALEAIPFISRCYVTTYMRSKADSAPATSTSIRRTKPGVTELNTTPILSRLLEVADFSVSSTPIYTFQASSSPTTRTMEDDTKSPVSSPVASTDSTVEQKMNSPVRPDHDIETVSMDSTNSMTNNGLSSEPVDFDSKTETPSIDSSVGVGPNELNVEATSNRNL
eukprot:CFRG1137T1